MKQLSEITVGFIGFGSMAGAIAKGLIRQGTVRPDQICACAKNWDKLCANTQSEGMRPYKTASEMCIRDSGRICSSGLCWYWWRAALNWSFLC